MNTRIPDSLISTNFADRINLQRNRLAILQERLTTGKRINRPSDDPIGAGAVINLRISQSEINQYNKNAQAANQKLVVADNALNGYTDLLERIRSLTSQALSDTTLQETKDLLAIEVETLRERILTVANTQAGTEYVFGGTRQDAPPYDPITGAPAATPTEARYVQIEPGTNAIPVGVTAENIFADATSDIFTDINDAIVAMRGTGDPIADKATLENMMERLNTYSDLGIIAQTRIGSYMAITDLAQEKLSNDSLIIDSQASSIEDIDFASAAIDFTEAQQALEATLSVIGRNQRNLIDFLG